MKVPVLIPHNATALAGDGFLYNYQDFLRMAGALGARLSEHLSIGAIFADNAPEWIVALYALWGRGACAVPLDGAATEADLAEMLGDCRPEVVFTDAAHKELLERALQSIGHTPRLIDLSGVCPPSSGDQNSLSEISREASDLALIVYTSGTTGVPKGVMLTFGNLQANVQDVAKEGYFTHGMSTPAMLPLHHVLPLVGTVIAPIYVGGRIVFPKSIAPQDISAALCAHPASIIVGVPRFYELLHSGILDRISRSKFARALFRLSKMTGGYRMGRVLFGAIHRRFGGKVRFWVCGGAALREDVWGDLKALGFNIAVGYGLSECAPIVSFPRMGTAKIGSSGQALSSTEIKFIDGEIAVRGANVTQGYLNKPEETAKAIRDGWFYTGDLGRLDADGNLFVTGRRKEVIVLPNGKKLDPFALESIIKEQSPDLKEVAVVSLKDSLQAILCFDDAFAEKLGAEKLREFARDHVVLPYNRAQASYRRILNFACTVRELPRTRVGKLKRFLLPAFFKEIEAPTPPATQAQSTSEPDCEIYRDLKRHIAPQISALPTPDAHLEMDLGLDSLGKVTLHSYIQEQYGVEIPEAEFSQYATLRSLAAHVRQHVRAQKTQSVEDGLWQDILKNPQAAAPATNGLHFLSVLVAKTIVRCFYRVQVKGIENVPDGTGAIIAANHQSYLDAFFAVVAFSKKRICDTYFLAKTRRIIRHRLLGWYVRHSNVIIMDIAGSVRDSLQQVAAALALGKRVVIFPEGTRSRDGTIAEFKSTFAILAKELGLPVVPTVISGAYEALKSRASLPKFGAHIQVRYLEPLRAEPNENYAAFADRVRAAIQRSFEDTP